MGHTARPIKEPGVHQHIRETSVVDKGKELPAKNSTDLVKTSERLTLMQRYAIWRHSILSRRSAKRAMTGVDKAPRLKHLRPDTPPTMGVRAWLWKYGIGWLYGAVGWKWLLRVTKVSQRESILRKEEALSASNSQRPLTIASATKKGGGVKSQNAVNQSGGLGLATNQMVVLADFNPNGNHANARFGIPVGSRTIFELLQFKNRDVLENLRTFDTAYPPHPNAGLRNIRAIPFDRGNEDNPPENPDYEQVVSLVRGLEGVSHFLVIDLGTDLGSNWTKAAVTLSDIVEVNIRVGQLNSAEDALRTIRAFWRMDPDNLYKCVIKVHGHAGKVTPAVIEQYYQQFEAYVAERPDDFMSVPLRHIFVIPYDEELDDNARQTKSNDVGRTRSKRPMDPRNYQRATYEAILDTATRYQEIADYAKGEAVKRKSLTVSPNDDTPLSRTLESNEIGERDVHASVG